MERRGPRFWGNVRGAPAGGLTSSGYGVRKGAIQEWDGMPYFRSTVSTGSSEKTFCPLERVMVT